MKKIAAMIGAVWALVSMVIVAMSILHTVPVGTLPVAASKVVTVASSGATSVPELAPPSCDEYGRDIALRLPAPTSAELLLQLAQEGVTQQTAQYAVDGWRDRGTPGNRVVSPPQTFVTNAWVPRSGSNGLGASWTPPQLMVGGRPVRFLRLEELLRANPGRWFIRRHDVFYVDVRTGTSPPQSIPGYISVTRTPNARIERHLLTPDTTRYTVDVTTGSGFNAQYTPVNGVTQLAQLFTGVPSFTAPVGTVERVTTWKVYARPGSITIPRIGYERQVQQACAAVPEVAHTINTPSREQRRLLARLLSRLDHVDEDLGAPADLKPVVSHARDLVMAALERRLDADQVEIDAARAESKAWKAAYLTVVDFVVRLQVGISNTLNTLARTGWVLLVIALLATFVAVRCWRKAGPPPISGDLIKRIKRDLLSEIEGVLTPMAHFMKSNTVGKLSDDDLVYIDELDVYKSIGDQIAGDIGRFFAVYGRVMQATAGAAPNKSEDIPAPPPPAVFKDLEGKEHPRNDDNIRAAIEAADATGFQRGKDSVVIPTHTPTTPSTPTFLDREGETVTLGNQDDFRAFEDRAFKAGAASRQDSVNELMKDAEGAEKDLYGLLDHLAKHKIIDAQLATESFADTAPAIGHQIEQFAVQSAKDRKALGVCEGALVQSQAAESAMVFYRTTVEDLWPIVFGYPLPENHKPTSMEIASIHRAILGRRVETGPMVAMVADESAGAGIVLSSPRATTNDPAECMRLIGSQQTRVYETPAALIDSSMRGRFPTQMLEAAHMPTSVYVVTVVPDEALPTTEAPAADSSASDPDAPVVTAVTKKPTEGHRSARRTSHTAHAPAAAPPAPVGPVTDADLQTRRVTPLSTPTQVATPTTSDRPAPVPAAAPTSDRPSFAGSPLVTGLRSPTPSGVHAVYPPAESKVSNSTG